MLESHGDVTLQFANLKEEMDPMRPSIIQEEEEGTSSSD